jgi:protein-S-isoprenylcysteine O-methyltransferase Ste14
VTRSASTPRLRLTTAYYVVLVVLAAVTAPRSRAIALDGTLAFGAVVLVSLSVLGRIWCSVFIAGRKDSELVTSGPYALCRHPLYALSIVGGAGLGLATASITLTAVTCIVLLALSFVAAREEERALAARHGARFSEYAALVPKWWPRWRNWHVPLEMRVHPGLLWKAFVDAGAFLLLYALIVAAGALRAGGILPTLLTLP